MSAANTVALYLTSITCLISLHLGTVEGDLRDFDREGSREEAPHPAGRSCDHIWRPRPRAYTLGLTSVALAKWLLLAEPWFPVYNLGVVT